MLMAVTLLVPIVFFIAAYNETRSFDIHQLGITRYRERMQSAIYYSILMLIVLGCCMGAIYYIIHLFFNRYIPILQTLNNCDIERLKAYNDLYSPLHRYNLPIIFSKNTMYIMKGTAITVVEANTLHRFELHRKRGNKSMYYQLKIQTTAGRHYEFILPDNTAVAARIKEDLEAIVQYNLK